MVFPSKLLTLGFGHNDMFWYRLIERLGRNSAGGNHRPRPCPSRPRIWRRTSITPTGPARRGYVATTVGEGCILGVGLTASADDAHLEQAYGVFAAEARDVNPEYAPETVNTDGWAANCAMRFRPCFP